LYLSDTALILDAALRDFDYNRDQQYLLQDQTNNTDNNANSTNNHSDVHLDTDPSLLHKKADLHLTKTALIPDDVLNDFRHAADQHPLYKHPNEHDDDVAAPPHQQNASTLSHLAHTPTNHPISPRGPHHSTTATNHMIDDSSGKTKKHHLHPQY
jgi:hypothetical protein